METRKKPSSMPIFEDIRGRTTGVCVRESERIVNETGGKPKMCFHQDNCLWSNQQSHTDCDKVKHYPDSPTWNLLPMMINQGQRNPSWTALTVLRLLKNNCKNYSITELLSQKKRTVNTSHFGTIRIGGEMYSQLYKTANMKYVKSYIKA